MKLSVTAAIFGLSLLAAPAFSATVTVNTDSAIEYNSTSGIAGYTGTGASLSGATFVATFADGSSEIGTFSAYNRSTGGVSTTNVDLVQTGTTYSNAFSLTNYSTSALTSLSIDLLTASAVFDLTHGGETGTEGSNLGRSLIEPSDLGDESGNPLEGDIVATYSGIVSVGSDASVGDLFTSLVIDLSGTTTGGLLTNTEWSFIADTDLLVEAGDLQLVAPVPLPATLLPLAVALMGLGAVARRRNA